MSLTDPNYIHDLMETTLKTRDSISDAIDDPDDAVPLPHLQAVLLH